MCGGKDCLFPKPCSQLDTDHSDYIDILNAVRELDGLKKVFIRSGVYNTGRRGATGLHTLCNEIEPEDLRPGDLVFFHGTMGPDVKGITHVGIYVGNQMMIHAGDPVALADLKSAQWAKKIYAFGRLPIE